MKMFDDVLFVGVIFYVNNIYIGFDNDVYWNVISIFYKWFNYFVDNGFYVYYEFFFFIFCVQFFVVIGKMVVEFNVIVVFMFVEFIVNGIFYEWNFKFFLIFFDFYVDFFEVEVVGGFVLMGGWLFDYNDVVINNDGIIEVFKMVFLFCFDIFFFIVGYLFNFGYGVFVSNSVIYFLWCNVIDFVIIVLFVFLGVSKVVKVDFQNVLINIIDQVFCDVLGFGVIYVNEVDFYQFNWQGYFWGFEYFCFKQICKKWDFLGVFYLIVIFGIEDWEVIQDIRFCKKF